MIFGACNNNLSFICQWALPISQRDRFSAYPACRGTGWGKIVIAQNEQNEQYKWDVPRSETNDEND